MAEDRRRCCKSGASWIWSIDRLEISSPCYAPSHCYSDLHAAPGAQNNDAHAGTGTGRIEFWKHPNLRATVFCLEVLLRTLVNRPNIVGLELINEPAANSSLWNWYQSTFTALRSISPDMPLYIGDAWDPNTYTTKAGGRDDHIVCIP